MTPSGGGASMVALDLRYHVPRSQVWEGSRGGQRGNVHLHVRREFAGGEPLVLGRIRRLPGEALCKRSGWYERGLDERELDALPAGLCPRCAELAARLDPDDLTDHADLPADYPGATVAYNIARARVDHATVATDRFGA